jgi:steroid 5-alpha reductase family enzyme
MTSLTGKTEQTLKGTVSPPTLAAALGGSVAQFGILAYVWINATSLGDCVTKRTYDACLDDPWSRQVIGTLSIGTLLWLYSLRTLPSQGRSYPSIVDRIWSILPWLYSWHLYLSSPTPRGLIMALLSSVWGVRLTYNFFVKGGFSGGEDYRWEEIRTWPGFKSGWEAFNIIFICGFQQLVILAFSSPAAAPLNSTVPLNIIDLVASILYAALVLGEATADKQMLIFQTEKYRRIKKGITLGSKYEHGFIRTGLWAYSRHPNYFCEVSLWWAYYLFSIAAGLPLINWTMCGPLFLSFLFILPHASLDVTEHLSSRKYPAYESYQKTVSRFIPLPPYPEGELPPLSIKDKCFIFWFVIGILITYLIDFEQVLVPEPSAYGMPGPATPRWPPAFFVKAVHWWGNTADKLVLARPIWFQVAIWLEVVVQAPFYLLAILAFQRRANWVRMPAIIYSTVLLTIMPMVLTEQYIGPHATDKPYLVTAVYGAYVIMPILVLLRVKDPDVFPKEKAVKKAAVSKTPAKTPKRAEKSPKRVK